MSESSPTNRSGMSLRELDPLPRRRLRLCKVWLRLSEGWAFTTCHIWGGLASLECGSFLAFIAILKWDLCWGRERELSFMLYLQTPFPIRLCLHTFKFNIPIKERKTVKQLFCLHNTKWLVRSICLTELVWFGADTLIVSLISSCSTYS